MAQIKKNADKEPPAGSAVVEADVNPEADGEPTEVSKGSYTPPSYPNAAADESEPHEDTRPETKAERKDRLYGTAEDRD